MTPEELSAALQKIFKYKIRYGYTDCYIYSAGETEQEKTIAVSTLFSDEGQYKSSGELLLQLIIHDENFRNLEEFIFQISNDSLSDNVLKSNIVSFERYLKDIIGIIKNDARAEMDRTRGLNELIDIAKTHYGLVGDNAADSINFFRDKIRNKVGHGNLEEEDIFNQKGLVAALLFVCLLHIVSRCPDKLKTYLSEKAKAGAPAPATEEEVIKKYVGLCREAYASYLETNVLHDSAAGVSLMPVLVRDKKDGSDNSVDALKMLKIARSGKYIILGVPGAGKSTLLNSYLQSVCDSFEKGESDLIPLLINASEVGEDKGFIEMIRASAAEKSMGNDIADKLLDRKRFAIAIDGINEFRSAAIADKFLRQVMEHPDVLVVMTGRIYEYASARKTIEQHSKDSRVFEIQDISSETITRFVDGLNFDEERRQRMLNIFFNDDRITGLLSCPLNLKILIDTISIHDGNDRDLRLSNRGSLIAAFISAVGDRETDKNSDRSSTINDAITLNHSRWLLENLALRTLTESTVSIDSFAAKTAAAHTEVYGSKENVIKTIIEPLVRAGILETDTGGITIRFRIDTFREYFLASIYAESFNTEQKGKTLNGRPKTELPAVDDDNNNETFRLMLEIMEPDSARDLTEHLFSLRCNWRKTVNMSPRMFISKRNAALPWICKLVSTLDTTGRLDAKEVCGNWVVNNLNILGNQNMVDRQVAMDIIKAGASLCTERVIRYMTEETRLRKMIDLGWNSEMAEVIAANASNPRLLHRILVETMRSNRWKKWYIESLSDIHRRLLERMSTLQLELLHRDIGRDIQETEAKNHSVPAEVYADYYLTALLTTNIELIDAVDSDIVKKTSALIRQSDYNRLLGSCATADTDSAVFRFFAERTDKYEADINILVHVIRYLVEKNNEPFASALLANDSFVGVVHSDAILREICAMLPIQLLPGGIAQRLYEPTLLRAARANAEERNFARNLRNNAEVAYAALANDNLYFNTASASGSPKQTKCNTKLLSIDGKEHLTVVCSTLANTEKYAGAKAILEIGSAQTREGTVEKCEVFGGDYFEMVFSFRGKPVEKLNGYLYWYNAVLNRKDRLEYSMCVYAGNTLMLRFTSESAMQQLRKAEVREAIASPLTVFNMDRKQYIPLRSMHYPEIKNGTRICICLDEPSTLRNRDILNIETITMKNADGNAMPVFQQNYVAGKNKSAQSLLFIRQQDSADGVLLFDAKTAESVCTGLWISVRDINYHARVIGTETVEKVLDCANFNPGRVTIPPSGTFTIDGTDVKIDYLVRGNDGDGTYRLFLLADEAKAKVFAATKYPKLIFSDGSEHILQNNPDITDLGAGTSVRVSLRGAPADIAEKWTAAPVVDFNVLRSAVNDCKVRNTKYATTSIPYSRNKKGNLEIPVPADALFLEGMTVYVNDPGRNSLPCTIHRLSGTNKFARTMEVVLKNPDGRVPAIDKDRGLLFIKSGYWLEYLNVLDLVQFDNGILYHPDMVRIIIEAMIQNNDTRLDENRIQFFRDSRSFQLLEEYDGAFTQL